MSPQQQRAVMEAFNSRTYFGGMGALGVESAQITNAVGSGLLSAAGIVAVIPGGQLPGAVIAAVGALTGLIGGFFKPDLTKVQASRIVDDIEAQTLKPLRASWQSLPVDQKTASMQAQYLAIFDRAWQAVMQGCSNPALASAGQNCTADRAQGACHYTIDGHTPGQPPSNCGNWFTWYRDVIANDPEVHPDPPGDTTSTVSSFSDSIGTLFGGKSVASPVVPLVAGAIILYALFGMGD